MNESAASAGSAAARIDSNKAVQDATTMLLIAGALLGLRTFSLRVLLVVYGNIETWRPRNPQDGSASAPALWCVSNVEIDSERCSGPKPDPLQRDQRCIARQGE